MLLPISTFLGNVLHAFLRMENSRVQMCTRSSFQDVLSLFFTVTQGKSMHLETRVVFFRCSSYIFTSSVQLSSASSSLAKNLGVGGKKWRRIILNHLPRTWTAYK